MAKKKKGLTFKDKLLVLATIFTPVVIILKFLNIQEPENVFDVIRGTILLIITGAGGIGIGSVFADKLMRIMEVEDDG